MVIHFLNNLFTESLLMTSHKGAVTAVAWSPDGELVVSGGECGDIIVRDQLKTLLTLQVNTSS